MTPVNLIPVIMAGGSGTRLWPLSRERFPKQFLSIAGEQSLFQQAVLRGGLFSSFPSIVIANEEHRFLVAEQLRLMNRDASILLEPVGRNTAPAIALSAFQAMKDLAKNGRAEAALLLVLAADHVIKDTAAFQKAAAALLPAVQAGKFGTLGLVPTEAATG